MARDRKATDNELTKVFGRRVREKRNRRDWSQQRLSEEIEAVCGLRLSQVTLAKIETGERKSVSVEDVLGIALAFASNPLDLLIDKDSHWIRVGDLELGRSEIEAYFGNRDLPAAVWERELQRGLSPEDDSRATPLGLQGYLNRRMAHGIAVRRGREKA